MQKIVVLLYLGIITFAVQAKSDIESLQNKINAYGSLLKIEKSIAKKIKIHNARAGLFLSLSKEIRNKSQSAKISESETKALQSAIAESESVLKLSKADKDLSFAYYIRAMANTEFNKNQESADDFQKSIQLDSTSDRTGAIAIYLGEYFFEHEDYKNAIKYYLNFEAKMDSQQKDISSYKAAWCYINQKDWQNAERMLMKLILKQKNRPKVNQADEKNDKGKHVKSEFSQDSLRDLAFLHVQINSEDVIIEKSKELVSKKLDPELLFLNSAFSILQRQSLAKGHKVFMSLLEQTTDSVKRVQLRLTLMRTFKSEPMNSQFLQSYLDLQNEYLNQRPSWPKIQSSLGTELEQEFNQALSLIIDLYSKKQNKNSSSVDSKTIDSALKYSLTNYLIFYPNSKMNTQVIHLLMDFCQKNKDKSCLNDISLKIISDEHFKSLHEQAHLILLDAQEDSKLNEDKYLVDLQDFIKKFPNSTQILAVKSRELRLLVKQKKWAEAIPVAQELNIKQHSADTHFELLWLRFQNEDYQRILDEPIQKLKKKDERVNELRREAALKLAMTSNTDTDQGFNSYQLYIEKFIQMSHEPDKINAALLNFFERAVNKKKYSEAIKLYHSLVVQQKKNPDVILWIKKILANCFYEDKKDLIDSFFKDQFSANLPDYFEAYSLYLVTTNNVNIQKVWPKLSDEKKKYYIGLFVLTKPALVIKLIKPSNKMTEKEKALYYLAIRIEKNSEEPNLSNSEKLILDTVLPPEMRIYAETKIEKNLLQISVKQARHPKDLKSVKSIITQVQNSRVIVLKSLKEESTVVKKRILISAANVEASTAELILKSNIPKQITTDQISEYRSGLKKLATDFELQEAEYKKVLEKIINLEKSKTKTAIIRPSFSNWHFPKNLGIEVLNKRLKTLGDNYVLLHLELLKNRNEITVSDYYWARSWVLLQPDNKVLTSYVYDELNELKQTEILNTWNLKK